MPVELRVRAKQGTHRESIIHPSGLLYTHWMRCQPVSLKEPFLSTSLYCPLTERERSVSVGGRAVCERKWVCRENGARGKNRSRGDERRRRGGHSSVSPFVTFKCWSLDKALLVAFSGWATRKKGQKASVEREREKEGVRERPNWQRKRDICTGCNAYSNFQTQNFLPSGEKRPHIQTKNHKWLWSNWIFFYVRKKRKDDTLPTFKYPWCLLCD